jgi:hypothetical protein
MEDDNYNDIVNRPDRYGPSDLSFLSSRTYFPLYMVRSPPIIPAVSIAPCLPKPSKVGTFELMKLDMLYSPQLVLRFLLLLYDARQKGTDIPA